jgi:hypothetical protein
VTVVAVIASIALALACQPASVRAEDCYYGPSPELMAFREINSLTPDPALTAEIRADLEAIGNAWPYFRTICAHPSWQPSEVLVRFDEATAEAYHAGEFHGFDDLHASLGGLAYARPAPINPTRVAFGFAPLYHPVVLAELHQAVAGVEAAYPNAIGSFGCDPTDVERMEPHRYHFHEVIDAIACMTRDWLIQVQDGVPEVVWGGAIPVPNPAGSWGALKSRY